jgi:hypothetical protein
MMKSVVTTMLSALLAAGAMGGAARLHAAIPDHSAAGAVKVTIDYKGKGTVDGSHRVWVWLFETPDIGPGAIPIAQMTVEKNGDVAVFDVSHEKVWIAVAYDEKGVMGGDAPPPSGTPIGIYATATGAPEAVTAGAGGAVVVTFDDSLRMP